MKIQDLTSDSDLARIIQRADISLLSHDKSRIENEEHFTDANGNSHWVLSIRIPLKNEEGDVVQLIGVSTDITQIKQAENDLKARESELQMKSKNLEEVNSALKVLLKQREVDKKEAEEILEDARKRAKQREAEILSEAREEANRIVMRGNREVELERKKALDDMKEQIISIASVMAGKVVAASIDTSIQDSLINETLKEMGESTWQS